MTVLYLNLSIVYLFSLLSRYLSTPTSLNPALVKPHKLFVLLAISTLVLVSGLRNNIGDTYYYMHSYREHPMTWDKVFDGKDPGFNILQLLLQQLSSDPQLLLLVTALLTNTLIVITLYKYSRFFELSLYVYITLGYFLVSMNGVRQYLAAAIVFIATKYLLEGKFKRYVLVVLLASTFHQSALILIPIYFIVRRPAWSKVTFILLASSILIVLGFNQFMDLLFTAIEDTQYGDYKSFEGVGANKLRVAVAGVPLLIAYIGREKLKNIFPHSDVIINMSLLGFIFMVISTQNWIFARFTIYFGLYQLVLISWIVLLFREKDRKLVYFGIIVCYFIYFYFEHVLSLNIIYRSNYINL
ncbi:EpsG family protein [Alkalihalobacterium chitinilyticum]|uniref:EpsG family protein n=1 Tax=Alkalihalobacterium chitinilyticum TaxID=2980103 RepID=A0ABT5VE95_9BACI|nr:EpsG family protein [Alkalihalobacterium chitinilyticum]MDE5413786.1 EpsG family protein [Alkalihalobacterium chitinilyticum]